MVQYININIYMFMYVYNNIQSLALSIYFGWESYVVPIKKGKSKLVIKRNIKRYLNYSHYFNDKMYYFHRF